MHVVSVQPAKINGKEKQRRAEASSDTKHLAVGG
jgi:hypothetical protein